MADIFISYASDDRPAAQRLAGALEREGWSVWWDRVIPPGRTFAEAIEEQLTAAGCVVVLWSETAVASRWVQREARFADRRGKLIPALIAEVEPPFEFSDIHAAPLTGWEDREPHLGYRQLVEAVAGLAGPPPREQREREEATRREAEAEARRTAEEEEARREVEAEEESKRKAAEEERKRAEERRKADAELVRKKAEEEAARKKTEAEAKRKAPDHEARKKAEELAARKQADAEAERAAGAPQRTVRARTRFAMAAVAVILVTGIVGAVWWQSSTRTGEERSAQQVQTAAVEEAKRRASPASGIPTGQTFKDCAVCPEMVVVPAGSFMMGSPPDDRDRGDDEGPQHRVTIARPFAVGKFEVTFAEWDACVDDGGCDGYRPKDEWGRGSQPVMRVSWNDTQAYVKWLSGKTGKDYWLLTEAEWEYVARAGTTARYWWGDDFDSTKANAGSGTTQVDRYPPNPWGLHDVHGNVWEWVADCYEGDAYKTHKDYPAMVGSWHNSCDRVFRGGSWYYRPWDLRSANRSRLGAGGRDLDVGFRVARTL